MLHDAKTMVSGVIGANNFITPQTVTGTGVSVLSDYSIDLQAPQDIGEGQDVYLNAQVATAVTGGTSVEVQIISATDAALTGTVTVLGTTGAIPVASLVAGYRAVLKVPEKIGSIGQRYLGVRYVTVGAVAAGAWIAGFGLDNGGDSKKFYPGNFSVK